MGSINWTDVLKGATAFFLVMAGIGTVYVCVRLGGLLARMAKTVGAMTDEVVPILTRAQTTVDGINLELVRVDDIMVTAVNATKGAEKTVSSISGAVTAPVRKASGLAAMAKEAFATFRTRRVAGPDEAEQAAAASVASHVHVEDVATEPSPEARAADEFRAAAGAAGERFRAAVADHKARADATAPATVVAPAPPPLREDPFAKHVAAPTDAPALDAQTVDSDEHTQEFPVTAGGGARRRGPSLSQISWALPKRSVR